MYRDLTPFNFVVSPNNQEVTQKLGDRSFNQTGGALLFPLLSKPHEHTSAMITTNLTVCQGIQRVEQGQDDSDLAEPADPPLPNHQGWPRLLILPPQHA